jgi:hypothetical protein
MSFFNICEEFFRQINPQHYLDDEDHINSVFEIPQVFYIERDLEISKKSDEDDYVLETKFEICAETLAEWFGHCVAKKKD